MDREKFERLTDRAKQKYIIKQEKLFWKLPKINDGCEICGNSSWLKIYYIWNTKDAPLWYRGLHENMMVLCGKHHEVMRKTYKKLNELKADENENSK